VVGGVVGGILVVLALFYSIRRWKHREHPVTPENDIVPFRPSPTFLSEEPSSATTFSSNPKAGLLVPNRAESTSPNLPRTPHDAVSMPSMRARRNPGMTLTDAIEPSSEGLNPIHEMEHRLRSLESMVLLGQAQANANNAVDPSGNREDSANPPPPY